MKKSAIFILILVVGLGLMRTFAQTPAQKPLYDRLGGVYPIAAVVDDFIDRLLSDSVITANKNVTAAMEHITKAGLKFHITEMVCEAAGGPQKYTGRSMKESHQGLKISEVEWAASVKDFLTTLDKFKIPEKEKNELVAIVASTKADIVETKEIAPKKALPAPELPGLPGLPGPEPAQKAAPQAPKVQAAPEKTAPAPEAQAPAPEVPAPEAQAPEAPNPEVPTAQ